MSLLADCETGKLLASCSDGKLLAECYNPCESGKWFVRFAFSGITLCEGWTGNPNITVDACLDDWPSVFSVATGTSLFYGGNEYPIAILNEGMYPPAVEVGCYDNALGTEGIMMWADRDGVIGVMFWRNGFTGGANSYTCCDTPFVEAGAACYGGTLTVTARRKP